MIDQLSVDRSLAHCFDWHGVDRCLFVLGCKDDEGTCSVLGVVIIGFNMIFAHTVHPIIPGIVSISSKLFCTSSTSTLFDTHYFTYCTVYICLLQVVQKFVCMFVLPSPYAVRYRRYTNMFYFDDFNLLVKFTY